jgi:uncharacterized protein (UPF0261 family)
MYSKYISGYRCAFSKSATPIFQEVSGLLGNESLTYRYDSMFQEAGGAGASEATENLTFSYLSVVQIDATKNEVCFK